MQSNVINEHMNVGLQEWAPDRERDKLRPRTTTARCADYLQDIWQFNK